jgi:polyisoprenoid-binding protein YceI
MFMANAASASAWMIDPQRSTLSFQIVETGNPVTGRFARWTADIRFDPANPSAARLRVQVETASATTGERRRDDLVIGPDWLDSARVPLAVFEADGFRPLGGDCFEANGTLRLRDSTRPLTLSFTLDLAGDGARARGRGSLVRTQFGVGQGQWAGQTSVAFEVAVIFDIVASRLP